MEQLNLEAAPRVPEWIDTVLARLNHAEKWARECGAHPVAMWLASKPWETYAESERARNVFFRKHARAKAAAGVATRNASAAINAAFPWWSGTYRVGRAEVSLCLPTRPQDMTPEIARENAHSLALIAGVDAAALERWVLTGECPTGAP